MKIYVMVKDGRLVPLYGSDHEEKQRLKPGKVYCCEIRMQRNWMFHKKFFSLVRLAFDNLPHRLQEETGIRSEEDMLDSIKSDLGLGSVVRIGGRDVFRPGSISFASMDETEFGSFYRRTVSLLLGKYLKGTDRDDLLEEVERYM